MCIRVCAVHTETKLTKFKQSILYYETNKHWADITLKTYLHCRTCGYVSNEDSNVMMLLVEAVRSSRSNRASQSVFTIKGTWET